MEPVRTYVVRLRVGSRVAPPVLAGLLVLAFAVAVPLRPVGPTWDRFFDVVVFNAVYLPAVAATWQAARRVPRERLAWRALTVSLLLNVVANATRTLVAGVDGAGSSSVLAVDLLSLGAYLTLWLTLVGFVRARVPRFHPSMWLDGVIGAFGASAVGIAFLLGPYLTPDAERAPLPLAQLSLPTTDVLLLALLVAMGAILGVRLDRTLLLVATALGCTLVADVVLFSRTVAGTYVDGGTLELVWLTGILLVTVAAHLARARPVPREPPTDTRTRLGWRLLALPLIANVSSLVVLACGWGDSLPPAAAWLAIGCALAALARTGITFREVRAFNEVREQARTDELTSLPNRRALLEETGRVLADATAQAPCAFLLLDLDGFKEVNDSLGHQAGDHLLRDIGPRLRDTLPAGALLARLGGDEFAVLLPDADLDSARATAEAVRARVLEPFTVQGVRLHVGVSIGVASGPVPATTVQELLRCADIAMYAAKSGREGVHVYVPDPLGGGDDRLRTMEELRTALDTGELVVHLQPQSRLADGRVVGVEALVRWNHPVRGLLSPVHLLPAAEQAGLMRPLTDCVLDLALTAAAGWWSEHPVPVSVNLSAANVSDLDLPWKVQSALGRHALPASALTLELVEDTLMADPERGRIVLGELRRIGVRTSIDDYGTGYSSLAYLRTLPADELKLDRSLTRDVDTDPRARAIVKHTVALAHDLGLELVAEGVEDDATAAALADLGCDVAQGFAIARPMPVADFRAWLGTPRPSLLEQARA